MGSTVLDLVQVLNYHLAALWHWFTTGSGGGTPPPL
jgi:hypothetical protein